MDKRGGGKWAMQEELESTWKERAGGSMPTHVAQDMRGAAGSCQGDAVLKPEEIQRKMGQANEGKGQIQRLRL